MKIRVAKNQNESILMYLKSVKLLIIEVIFILTSISAVAKDNYLAYKNAVDHKGIDTYRETSENPSCSGLNEGIYAVPLRVYDNSGDWSTSCLGSLNTVGKTSGNLVADWKFNEKSGTTANDNSGNSNTGTLINSPTWVPGLKGTALNFTDNYINIPGSASLNSVESAITITAWVKANASTTSSNIIERWLYGGGVVNQRAYCLYITATGTIAFGLSSDGTSAKAKWLTSTSAITRDTWTYITATFDGTTMKIYINGTLDISEAPGFSTIFIPTGNVHIGKWQTNATTWVNPYKGIIDEVKIYNKALSLNDIQSLIQFGNIK